MLLFCSIVIDHICALIRISLNKNDIRAFIGPECFMGFDG
jgi:hypothetical protein